MPNDINYIKSTIANLRTTIEKTIEIEPIDLNRKSKKENETEIKQNDVDNPLTNLADLEAYLDQLLFENNRLKEEKLMAVAESQNTVRRMKEKEISIKKYAAEKLAASILPAIDMFRVVLLTPNDNPEIINYLKGFEMIIKQMDNALLETGINQIQTKVGDEFNPEIHQAIEQIETDVAAPEHIATVVSNGYMLHDRVIKHVLVKVAK
ncbi:nucleotide exchange factor GrpE [Spiroplasma endosymbiont of Labia minor]|uniref:nucleotide exchange factor GrpE n=1 Tax=Spiroplasma endosymbiont of Labia minor TaxID=3066305 RepID=UPI0030CC5AE3